MASVGLAAKVDGIDPQQAVSAVSAFARSPLPSMPPTSLDQASERDTRISAAGRLQSAMAQVTESAQRLLQAQTWDATKATASAPQVLDVASASGKPGAHSVVVDSLAAAQATASATFSSLSTVIGLGTLNIELGSWNASQTAFATNPNWPKANVTLGPKDTSLERIRDKINAAGVGVIASVLSDATGSRLVLRSTSSGAANGFKVGVEAPEGASKDASQQLAALGFDPSAVQGHQGMTLMQAGQDAQVRIDDRLVQSPGNLVADEPTGLTLGLKASSPEAVTVQVQADPQAVVKDVDALAQSYNQLAVQLRDSPPATTDQPEWEAAQQLTTRMQAAWQPASGAAPAMQQPLREIGLNLDDQGLLHVDKAQLGTALLERPQHVRQVLAANPADAGAPPGLATRLLAAPAPAGAEPAQAARPQPALPAQASPTSAGAVYKQRLLEQYAQTSDAAAAIDAQDKHDSELGMHANAV